MNLIEQMSKQRVKQVTQIISPDTAQETWVEVLYFIWVGLESVHTFNIDVGKVVTS